MYTIDSLGNVPRVIQTFYNFISNHGYWLLQHMSVIVLYAYINYECLVARTLFGGIKFSKFMYISNIMQVKLLNICKYHIIRIDTYY